MPAIFKDGKWYIGDNSGHMIKDNGTDMYPREALNFTDFNVQDDSVNDETDIKPHRLTQEELSEIMSKKPAPQDGFPILFDERGVERQVGWYAYSDGTKKSVYEKHFDGKLTNGNGVTTVYSEFFSDFNVDIVINISGVVLDDITRVAIYPLNTTNLNYYIEAIIEGGDLIVQAKGFNTIYHYRFTIQYTKTTDQPQ